MPTQFAEIDIATGHQPLAGKAPMRELKQIALIQFAGAPASPLAAPASAAALHPSFRKVLGL